MLRKSLSHINCWYIACKLTRLPHHKWNCASKNPVRIKSSFPSAYLHGLQPGAKANSLIREQSRDHRKKNWFRFTEMKRTTSGASVNSRADRRDSMPSLPDHALLIKHSWGLLAGGLVGVNNYCHSFVKHPLRTINCGCVVSQVKSRTNLK